MVCKVEDFMKKKKKHEIELKRNECMFKRRSFTEEEDATSFAMLLLAYLVFTPPFST